MSSGGQHYPSDIKERARSIAAKIRAIADPEERKRVARQVSLNAVIANSTFPEELFLKDCGLEVNTKLGPALRVKKTKYGVRTKRDDGSRWGDLWRDPSRKRELDRRIRHAKESGGYGYEHGLHQEEHDDTEVVASCVVRGMTGELLPVYIWQNRMY